MKAEGTAETGADETLLKAINDDKITVNIDATKANQIDEGFIVGGAFLGNTVNDDGTKTATQVVNPDQTEVLEKLAEAPTGTIAMHETIEAYQGARFSPGAKASTKGGNGFDKAHDLANKTDPRGAVIQDKLSVAADVKNGTTTVNVTVKSTGKKTVLYTEQNK